jgi:hypothetical protein
MTDSNAFVEAVRVANQTPLSRLGSSKYLYAETGGELESEPVLLAVAQAERAAWQTFEAWAEDEANEAVRAFFETVAEEERNHFERVAEQVGAAVADPDAIPALHEYLREQTETVDRLGAFVGRALASKRSKDQVVGYFVGNADPQTAELFRGFGGDVDDQLERAAALQESLEWDEARLDRAREAASGAIGAAYREYVERLESMGVNPKPVC